jgi:hypothetical protein
MQERPYYSLMDQICRSNGWLLGQDKGEMVLGIPQQDGSQQSVVINDFVDTSGQAAMRMWSPVAAADRVPADQALQVNFQLPAGALAVREGQVVVCATRIVNVTNQAELAPLLQTLAHFAKFYASHYGG